MNRQNVPTNSNRVIARCPSNIALIKYWGKSDKKQQWPANDSLSMTLSQCYSETTASLIESTQPSVFYGGQQLFPSDPFAKKIFSHIDRMSQNFGFRQGLRIETKNSFPSSCGIASSASGMAALTLASLAAWSRSQNFEDLANAGFTSDVLRHWARMGSGSACRSLDGGFVHWSRGESADSQTVAPIFGASHWGLCDLIVVVSSTSKRISSSIGHDQANYSPFFKPRLAGLPHRLDHLRSAIAARDLARLGEIIEVEAMEMHAIMATGVQPLYYANDDTWRLVEWIRMRRRETEFKAYFTIDAGPNLHLLCEQKDAKEVVSQIASAFPKFEIICDKVGDGPRLSVELEKTS